MKTKKARDAKPASPSGRRKSRFTLRGRRKKNRAIRGKLRIRSLPGAFLVLGVVVVVVGTALAVAGYWPYRIPRASFLAGADAEKLSQSQTSGWGLGAKGLLSTATFIHSERMKLLGPVIMGVGLFILICANTVLYENRDRETQMLVAQMRSVICSVSAAVPSADLKEIAAANSMSKHYQWVGTLPAAHLNILCLQQLASSEPRLRTGHPTDPEDAVEGMYRQAVLRTEALHHQESGAPPSLRSAHANTSSKTDVNTRSGLQQGGSGDAEAAPFAKPSSCMMSASSMSTLEVDEVDVPAAQPRRCHSLSYRTNPHTVPTGFHILREGLRKPRDESQVRHPEVSSREAESHVSVNIMGQVAEDAEEQMRQSWPQLDLACSRRYLKLENKEDSVDKLLDQLEQQYSQWDKSFGSGPFQ